MNSSFLNVNVDVWVFDNDGTLYPCHRIHQYIVTLMVKYVVNLYQVTADEAKKIIETLKKKHETNYTYVAMLHEGIDVKRFIEETYLAARPEEFGINPNPKLLTTVEMLSGDKYLMTNNPEAYARMILDALGLQSVFNDVWGMEKLNYYPKSTGGVFRSFTAFIGLNRTIALVDDMLINLKEAKRYGWKTFWFSLDDVDPPGYVDCVINSLVVEDDYEVV